MKKAMPLNTREPSALSTGATVNAYVNDIRDNKGPAENDPIRKHPLIWGTLGLQPLERNGGDDGTRTRGLCRDRAAF